MENNIDQAYELLKDISKHVFLTGNAGTGKSTLIRKFINEHIGKCIVLAPTGIAAINVGGQTIHKFFGFPTRPINYNSVKKLTATYDWNKIQMIKKAQYLIIDEISMVRPDIMDQIFWYLKKNNFTHLKFIMVGDLDQLPPVVASEGEREMLAARYDSEFFFDAKCWQENRFEMVRLTKVWRQSDPTFVNLLNDIKLNRLSDFDLDKLNNTCRAPQKLEPNDGIYLCTTNKIADEVNRYMMERLETKEIILDGEVRGDFDLSKFNIEKNIILKPGCRIMTMRNDPEGSFFNGTIGTFEGLYYDEIRDDDGELIETSQFVLEIRLDNGDIIHVSQFEFEQNEFEYNEKEDNVSVKITGTFVQYPIRIAYALSIHKSQGQTFDKCIIDIGYGAFAHGQVYVALSRCRSLEGLKIVTPIRRKDLIYSDPVFKFYENRQSNPENAKA